MSNNQRYANAASYLRRQLVRTFATMRNSQIDTYPEDWDLDDMEEAIEIAISLVSAINVAYDHDIEHLLLTNIKSILDEVHNETT